MYVKLKSITPDAENTIVEIARVSSSRKDKSENPTGLINYLIKNKHWSPFQHGHITFEIETSKAIGIQLIRHRSFTFQEFSQRYSVVDKIEEIELRQQAETNRQSSTDVIGTVDIDKDGWAFEGNHNHASYMAIIKASDALVRIEEAYFEMLEAGVARECARMFLPMATSTKIYMTGTVRSWIHFMDIRDDEHAQKEVREIAVEIKKLFSEQLPTISKALGYV